MKLFRKIGNWVGHRMPQNSIIQAHSLQECQTKTTSLKHPQWGALFAFGILAGCKYVERSPRGASATGSFSKVYIYECRLSSFQSQLSTSKL